jgi:hypothetical protein
MQVMMQKISVQLIDDLDGAEATQTVTFSLDGVDYEIDLSEENATRLREAIAEFVEHARRVTRPGKRSGATRHGSTTSTLSEAARRTQNQAIRAWARKNGYTVLDRGRLAAEIISAYHAAH